MSIVSAQTTSPDDTIYKVYSNSHEEQGYIKDIHLTEQYTNGSFIVDTNEFGELIQLIVE